MRKEQSLVLDDRDEALAALLMELGIPRNVSRCLMYLAQVDEAVSADLEKGAGLRQPEVSVAMQWLREREWVTKRDIKKKGKGRPVHCYRLTRSLDDVIGLIEKEKRMEAERDAERIARFRALADDVRAPAVTRVTSR